MVGCEEVPFEGMSWDDYSVYSGFVPEDSYEACDYRWSEDYAGADEYDDAVGRPRSVLAVPCVVPRSSAEC